VVGLASESDNATAAGNLLSDSLVDNATSRLSVFVLILLSVVSEALVDSAASRFGGLGIESSCVFSRLAPSVFIRCQ